MPKKIVMIEWDQPDDENWLADDNVALALHAYCPDTHFTVVGAGELLRVAEELLLWRAKLVLIMAPYLDQMEGARFAMTDLSTVVYQIQQGRPPKPSNREK